MPQSWFDQFREVDEPPPRVAGASWFDQFREVDEPPPRVAGTSWFDQFREVDAPTTYDDEFGRPAVPSSRVVGPRKARALGSEPDVRARRGWPEPPALAPLESRPLVPSSLLSPVVLPTLAPRRVGPMQPQTGQARRSDDQADVVGRSDRDPPTIPNRAIRYRAAKRPPPEADRPPSPADQEFGTPRIPQPRDGTDGSRIRDLGISLAKGLITVPDAALGLSDIFMTGGFAGQGAETLGFRPTEWKATLDTYYSDQQQRANRSVQEADGLIEKATAALTHPSTIAHAVIESLPLMAAGGAVGRVVSTAMRPFMAGAVGEGVVSAGASAAEIRQQSETGRLTPGQRAVAGTSGTLTGALGALGGRIAERLGVVDVNTLLAAGLTDPVAYQNLFRAIVFGAFQEGVLEELPQSVQEQVLQNAATDRPLWEHVDTAAVMGTLAGAVMGGGAQVAALAGPRTTAPETGVDEPAPGTPPGDVPVSEAPPPSGRPAPAAQPTSWFDQFQEAGDIPLDAPPPPSPGARVDEEIESARPLPGTETPAAPARHDYSSTQVTLPPTERADIARLANTIPNEDLAEKGREAEPHITVKYGLHSRPDALATLQEILRDEPPVTVTFGKTAIFPDSGDGDVVKVDIESPDLRRLHKKIADALPNTETHGDYTPHATVAYVQPGLGKKYVGRTDLEGRQVTFDQMLFAGTDDTKTSIPLPGRGGPSPAAIDPPDAGEARKSVRTPQVTREALEQSETRELRRIAAELEAFPFAGKTYREAGPRRGGDLAVQGRTPGAAVYWDIVGGTPERPVFRYSRGQVAEKLEAFLRDGTRSVVSDLAVDVAKRRLHGDPTVRTPDLPPEAGDPRIQVAPLDGLSDADAAVQARAIRAVEANPDELVQRYEARFGKVVGADHAKTLFGEDYTDPESRTRHTQAVHQPSSALAHHIFETRMQAAQPGDLMLMLSGGPGSGKTSSIRNIPELPDVAHTIYDSNLTRRDGATRDIEAALDANLDVGIVHVLRDPVVAFRDGVVPRAETQGRIVTIAQHVRNHGQARETFRALQKQYADNDRVGFTVIDNRGSAPEVVGVDVLNHEEYNEDDVRRRITHALEDAHAAGRISDAVYAATKGASAQGVAEDPGRRHPPIQRVGRQVARLGRVEPSPPRDAAQPTTRRTRPLVLTKNPAGTWSFGGSVPKDLAYANRATGAPISDEDAAQIAQHGPGLFRARIRSLTWPSEADALAAARVLGIDEVDGYDGKTIPTAPRESPSVEPQIAGQPPTAVGWSQEVPDGRTDRDRPGRRDERRRRTSVPDRTASPGALGAVPAEPRAPAAPAEREGPTPGDSERVPSDGVRDRPDTGTQPGAAPVTDRGTVPRRALSPSGAVGDAGPVPPDYRLTSDRVRAIVSRGSITRVRDNLAALDTVKAILADRRYATPDEQDVLAKYVGWGDSAVAAFLDSHPRRTWTPSETRVWQAVQDATTAEERAALIRSAPNAHFTYDLYAPIWQALERYGFTGGRVLEPAVGTGHAFGVMPAQMQQASTLSAVELEPMTAAIAQALYPSARVQPVGYEEARIPRNTQDLVISNVPFGDFGVRDRRFPAFLTKRIHNYFFANALEHVRPGGLVAFITSRYTMDAQATAKVRRYLMDRAHFLGAVRLPNTAFKQSAKTEVVTDLILLQKHQEGEARRPEADRFVATEEVPALSRTDASGRRVPVVRSAWYTAHPTLILGTESLEGSQYGSHEYTVTAKTRSVTDALGRALATLLPDGAYQPATTAATTTRPEPAVVEGVFKPGELRVVDDTVVRVTPDGETVAMDVSKAAAARVRGMVAIRDALRATVAAMRDPETSNADIRARQQALTTAYADFSKQYGTLNSRTNRGLFRDDPEAANLLGLEVLTPKSRLTQDARGKKILRVTHDVTGLADIFTTRTIRAETEVTHVDTPHDALLASLGTTTHIDWPYMSRISGQSVEALQASLRSDGRVFEQPDGSWVTADEYLSGDVKTKLADAEAAAADEPTRFTANVTALTTVQPSDKTFEDITIALGSHWVPPSDVDAFIQDELQVASGQLTTKLSATETVVHWTVEVSWTAEKAGDGHRLAVRYGPGDRYAYGLTDMLHDALNLRTPSLGWWEGSGDTRRYVKALEATQAARGNVEELRRAWTAWVYDQPEVQQRLVDTYNERFNRTVRRVYDGGHLQDSLTRHGLALPFDLYPHQLNAIWRTLSSGNTLLAHEVGAGKTFEMIVTAMEMRRTGRARKPLITVPTHLLSQWRADILKAYPAARVLAFDETDLAARKRQQAMARIAFGDWDIVLVPHSSFQLLKVSDARLITVMQDWVDELRDAEAAAQADGDRDSVKQMERKRRQIEDKVANKTKSLNRGQDNALTWEDLGVDALFVDEAHVFKNLFFFSKLDNLRGLSRSEADRSLDLYVKVQDINEQSNYRNLTLATATPVMNSMAELFTMQRYLQPHRLRQLGVDHFDNWYAMFGQALPTHEQRPDGSYHEVMRLRAFKNLDALYRTVTEVMDYVGWQDMPYLKLPTLKGNRVTVVQTDPHPMYETLRRWFEQRLAALRVTPPHVDRNTGKYIAPERLHPLTGVGMNKPDNILTVMNDAKAAAIDVRLVLGDAASDVPHSRVQTAARDLVTIYRAEATTKGVVLVFLDHGTPRDPPPLEFLSGVTIADQTAGVPLGTEADLDPGQVVGELEGEFNLYEALKAALVGHGVPSHEIAFIHQAKRAAERLALFDAANEGRIRVLVASTDKGGVGMNIQRRLAAIAHIDAPRAQRPGDLRQRDGRGIRQGNTYDEIDIRRYVTKGTTDEWLYGMLNQKATLINQFMRGDATEFHDDDPSTMSIEEAQIRATGDPRGIELTELRSSLARLTAQAAAAERAQAAAKASRAREERRRDEHDANLAAMETWIDRHAHNLTGDRFVMRVGATEYTGRKRANAAIRRVAAQVFSTREDRPVGQLGGLDVTATWSGIRQAVVVHLAHPTNGGTMLAATLEGAAGHIGEGRDVVRSLLNRYHAFREEPDTHRRAMREASEALARARRTLERPVDAVEKARAAQARIAALEAELTAESHAKDAALDQARRAQTAARADTTDEPPPTGGGSGAANVGTFAPTRPGRATTTPARPETIHPIEFPELVDLARRLQRTPKVVRAFRKAGKVGEFRPGSIRLAADLFKTGQEQQLAKTLAHEIGHLIDWLPTPTLKRGNILGRLRSLRSYLRGTFTGPDGTTIKNTAIRDELKALSATWRPWNRATSPARFREYRDSARELYADAVSVLLNDPELLTRDAPQFAQAFFDGLDRKPDVRQAYFELQEQLSGTRVELVEKRRAGVRRMWHEGNVKALELEQLRQRQTTERRHHLWFRLRHELLDKHTTFLDRVHALEQRGVTINPDDDPRYLLSERNYLGGKLKGFVEEQFAPIHQEILESGVGWATFGELLFYDRILAGDRSELANPKGLSPADATELRDRVIADLGPERARVATAAADRFRAVVKDVATQAHEAGLYTDELFKQMQANPAYVTFQVIDHLEDGVTSRVYRQIGTLKWIAHPADATVLKTLVTLRAIEHNRVKHTAIRFLHQHHPEDIENAKTVGSGRGRRPIESKDPDTHLVRYFKGGRLVGVYVDQYIADALENNSVGQNLMVIQLLQMVNGRYFRPVFTTFNLGFQTFNLARDVGRFWKATPQLRGTGIGDTLLRYWQAVPMAKVRAFGLSARPSAKELAAYRDLIDSEKAGILSITYNDFILGRETEDTQMEDVLARLGVTTFTPKPRRMVFRPFIQMLDTIKEVGDFIETIPKGAGIHHFRGDGEIADISPQDRAFIRERMGSPDFLAGGTAKAAMNNLLLFSNAIFQGVRADLKTATEPRTRAGFWWKTATVNLLPKAVMFLALAGLLGPDLKRLFQKVSEYDRTNYIPVPVGVDAHDNVIYIRIPQDDMGRLIGGLFWKALQVARDDDVFSSLGQLADYSAGQFPSVAPVFEAGLSTVQFVSGRNPYDAFRGRYVFTEDEFKARDWRTVKKFIGWQFQQLGGGIVWKFYPGEQRPRERTPAQKVLELPVVSNVIGRFVRITNYGEIEAFRGAQRQAARGEAQRRLTENEGINDAIRAYLELPADRQTVDERNTLARQLTRALYDSPRERADRENPIRTKLRIGILRGEADPLVDTLLSAGSNTEKVAILDAAQDTMAEDAFEAWLGMAVDQRIISRDVRADVLRRADARAAVEAGAGR